MGYRTVLRRVRAQAATVGLLAAAAMLPAAPGAHAEPQPAGITIHAAGHYYIPTAHSAYDGDSRFQFEYVAFGPGPGGERPEAHNVKVTVDVSAFAGKVRLTDLGYHCTASGAGGLVVTCDRGTVYGLDTVVAPLVIKPLDGATAGFAGDVKLTVTASDAPTATQDVHAVIGRTHLVTQTYEPRKDLAPGSTVSVRPVIGNSGEVASSGGVQVLFLGGDMDLAGPRYSNCHYSARRSSSFWCEFDQEFTPGTAYTPAAPFSFTLHQSVMEGYVSYLMFPKDTQETLELLYPPSRPNDYPLTGDGPPLTLTAAPLTGLTQNTGQLALTTTQNADLQAVGGTITGKPGDKTEMKLGVRNVGPGTVPYHQSGHGGFDVTIPAGVTVTSVFGMDPPEDPSGWYCSPGKAARAYHCDLRSDLPAGAFTFFRFEVRIDHAVPGAAGKVVVDQPTAPANHDPDPSNDVAPLLVKVTGGGTPTATPTPSHSTAGTSGSTSAGASGSTSGSGGTAGSAGTAGGATSGGTGGVLAHTGATGMWALAGLTAAVLAAGAAALAGTRLRRRRG